MNGKQIAICANILIGLISNPALAVIVSGGTSFVGDKKLAYVGIIPLNIVGPTHPFLPQINTHRVWLNKVLHRLAKRREPIQIIIEGNEQTLKNAQKEAASYNPVFQLGILPTIIQYAQQCAGNNGIIRFTYADHQGKEMRLMGALCNLFKSRPIVSGMAQLKKLYGDCTVQELFNELDTTKNELAHYVDSLTPTSHGHQIFSAYLSSLNHGIEAINQFFINYVGPRYKKSALLLDTIYAIQKKSLDAAHNFVQCHSTLSKAILAAGIFRALDISFRTGDNTFFIGSSFQVRQLLQTLRNPHEASLATDNPPAQLLTDDECKALQKGIIKTFNKPESLCCVTCQTVAPTMKCCGRCRKAYYCSAACQQADWPHHKKTCQQQSLKKPAQCGLL